MGKRTIGIIIGALAAVALIVALVLSSNERQADPEPSPTPSPTRGAVAIPGAAGSTPSQDPSGPVDGPSTEPDPDSSFTPDPATPPSPEPIETEDPNAEPGDPDVLDPSTPHPAQLDDPQMAAAAEALVENVARRATLVSPDGSMSAAIGEFLTPEANIPHTVLRDNDVVMLDAVINGLEVTSTTADDVTYRVDVSFDFAVRSKGYGQGSAVWAIRIAPRDGGWGVTFIDATDIS